MNGHIKEQRYRLYPISERLILTVLGGWKLNDRIVLPEAEAMPIGWELHAVQYDIAHRGFLLLVWHESFPSVPAGERIPIAPDAMQWREVVIQTDLHALWERQAEWSQKTFGTDSERGPVGPLKHLAKEAEEAAAHPGDPVEFADCFLLVLDAARRAGMTLDGLIRAAKEKHEINRERKWVPAANDAPVEHVREDQA